jgi:hypothetical protein
MVVTRAAPANNALEAAKTLLYSVCLIHGFPRVIISDQGKEYCNMLINYITELCKIDHRRTTAYNPRANGLTERFNQVMSTMLAHYCVTNQDTWDEHLPFATFAYNMSVNATTGYSPHFLVYGFEANLPIDTVLPVPQRRNAGNLLARAHEARLIANLAQSIVQDKAKHRFDATRREEDFAPGDKVYLRILNRKVGVSPKLSHSYAGPYVVVRQLAPNDFEITDGDGKKSQVVNVQRLKPYHQEFQADVEKIPKRKVTFRSETEVLTEENEPKEQGNPLKEMETAEDPQDIELGSTCIRQEEPAVETILPSGMRLRKRRGGCFVKD